jgi:hypothetical protein
MRVLDSLACARVMLSPWRSYSCLFSLVLVLLLVLRLQLVLSLPPNCLQSIVDRHEAPTSRQPPARRRAPPSARARAAPRYGCIYGAGTAFQRMDASTRRSHASLRSAAQSPWKREDYREGMLPARNPAASNRGRLPPSATLRGCVAGLEHTCPRICQFALARTDSRPSCLCETPEMKQMSASGLRVHG